MIRKTKKRVALRWNRNLDQNTVYYNVYRSTQPNVTREDKLIMKVHQIPRTNWIKSEQERPKRVSNIRYKLLHDYLRRDRPVTVYINKVNANHLVKTIDYTNGEIIFSEPPSNADVVTVNYEFDGIEIIDDYLLQSGMMEYFGPPAQDILHPEIPTNINIRPLPEQNGVHVHWDAVSTGGQLYYYRIDACDDSGNFSPMSNEVRIVLDGGLSNKGYVVERSIDRGNTWSIVSQIPYTDYYEFGVDTIKPSPVLIDTYSAERIVNQGKGKVNFTLKSYQDVAKEQASPMYRVYSQSSYGNISEPSQAVGPVYIKVPIKKIVVVRQDVATLGQNEIPYPYKSGSTLVQEITDFTQLNILDYPDSGKTYRYAFYAIDYAGTLSMATVQDITIANAKPPLWDNVEARRFPLIV